MSGYCRAASGSFSGALVATACARIWARLSRRLSVFVHAWWENENDGEEQVKRDRENSPEHQENMILSSFELLPHWQLTLFATDRLGGKNGIRKIIPSQQSQSREDNDKGGSSSGVKFLPARTLSFGPAA
ncbi:hypothetical protein V8E53_013553 [Lactarius tabidus]